MDVSAASVYKEILAMKSNTLCYQLLYISSFLVASDENIEIGHENLVGTKICQT